MKNLRLLFLIPLLLIGCFASFAQPIVDWTGKIRLVFDPVDTTIFYLQVVPDINGYGRISPGTTFIVITDTAVTYNVTTDNTTGNYTYTALDLTGTNPRSCGEAIHQVSYSGGSQDFEVFAGVPYNVAKFKATNNDCAAGAKARIYSNFNKSGTVGNPVPNMDECALMVGLFDNGLSVNNKNRSLTGVITNSDNPLLCPPNPCLEIIAGGEWNQSFTKAEVAAMPIKIIDTYDPITVAGTNAGMFFDIYRLDNSFSLTVNGDPIVSDGSSHEMQFDIGTPAARMNNIRFLDGDLYNVDAQPIWKIIGTATNPAVRIEVSPLGKVTLYGSKVSGGPLYELRLYNGAELNDVTWNASSNNIIEVTQDANGTTRLNGKVYGENICSTGFYKITKTGSFDNNPPFNPGDLITYTIQVKNLGNEDISDVVVVDPLLGGEISELPTGDTNGVGILNVGELWTYTITYPITAEDISRRGVYNLATVFGQDPYGNPIPTKKSFDPDGLQPGDPEYDPNCPTCTYTPITGDCNVIFSIVSTDPFYWAYNYSTYRGGQAPVTNSGTIVGTNEGFEFDIYRLDNSFNMIINGVKLYNDELQFDAKLTPGVNIEFVGGGEYGKNSIPRILSLRGDLENPMVRVKVAADGVVQLFGSKTSYGTLVELTPKTGSFNNIPWNTNPNQNNTVTVSQEVWWKTVFEGYGYGVQNNCSPDRPGGEQPVGVNDGGIYTAKYYPNPVNTMLYVQANAVIEEIEIYNILGQRVINLRPNSNETEINVEYLQADVYMMKLTLNGKVETYRVIKQ